MLITIREFESKDINKMAEIWNGVVADGVAFPQLEALDNKRALSFFASQSFSAVAIDEGGEIVGLYILHPNNEGRCGHIANASYAVDMNFRGQHIGEKLVIHCLEKARELGFRLMQFNAVVKTNAAAIHLYEKLGFVKIGEIPGGFLMKSGEYEDIILFYYCLQ